MCSWLWAEEPREKCRAYVEINKSRNVAFFGCNLEIYYDARTYECQIYQKCVIAVRIELLLYPQRIPLNKWRNCFIYSPPCHWVGCWSSSSLDRFTHGGKSLPYWLNGRPGRHTSQYGNFEEETNFLPVPGMQPWSLGLSCCNQVTVLNTLLQLFSEVKILNIDERYVQCLANNAQILKKGNFGLKTGM